MNPNIEKINKEKAIKAKKNLMNLTIEDLEFANEYSRQVYSRVGGGHTKVNGYGIEPPEVELNKLAQAVYKGRNDIQGYELLESSPTIGIYKKIADNTLVISVRGSADTQDWITNAQLPFNNLTNTQRYKTDKEYVMNAIAKYGKGNDIYITAHSLGGVIADQLKKDFEDIKSGTSFNPAFQAKDLFNSDESTVKRKYTAEDPLGMLGRYLKGAEVEAPKKNETSLLQKGLNYLSPVSSAYDFFGRKLKGHKLTEFESRKGGMEHDPETKAKIEKYLADAKKAWAELHARYPDDDTPLIKAVSEVYGVEIIERMYPDILRTLKELKDDDEKLKLLVSFVLKYFKKPYNFNDFQRVYEAMGIPKPLTEGHIPFYVKYTPNVDQLIFDIKQAMKPIVVAFGKKKVVKMDKKTYVKEHKKLIKLLESAGKEGKAQKKELKKQLRH
jgi:hypothetical protein